jgi:hypothetical protein
MVGVDEEKSQALSYTAISEGIWPVSIEAREGPHSGALQYALAKTVDLAARLSRWGVWHVGPP